MQYLWSIFVVFGLLFVVCPAPWAALPRAAVCGSTAAGCDMVMFVGNAVDAVGAPLPRGLSLLKVSDVETIDIGRQGSAAELKSSIGVLAPPESPSTQAATVA